MKRIFSIVLAIMLMAGYTGSLVYADDDNNLVSELIYDDFSIDSSGEYSGNNTETLSASNGALTAVSKSGESVTFSVSTPVFSHTGSNKLIISYSFAANNKNVTHTAILLKNGQTANANRVNLISGNVFENAEISANKEYKITFVIDSSQVLCYIDGVLKETYANAIAGGSYSVWLRCKGNTTAAAVKAATYDNIGIYEIPGDIKTEFVLDKVTAKGCTLTCNVPMISAPSVSVGETAATVVLDENDKYTAKVTFGEALESSSDYSMTVTADTYAGQTESSADFTTPAAPLIEYTLYDDGEDGDNKIAFDDGDNSMYSYDDGKLKLTMENDAANSGTNIFMSKRLSVSGDVLIIEYAYEYGGGGSADRTQRTYIKNISSSTVDLYNQTRSAAPTGVINVKSIIYRGSGDEKGKFVTYENGAKISEEEFVDSNKKDIEIGFSGRLRITYADKNKYIGFDYISVYEPDSSKLRYEILSKDATAVDGVAVRFNYPVNLSAYCGEEEASVSICSDYNVPNCYIINFNEKPLGTKYTLSMNAESITDSAVSLSNTSDECKVLTADIEIDAEHASVTDGEISVPISVKTEGTLPMTAIIAQYYTNGNDYILTSVSTKTITATASENSTEYSIEADKDSNADFARVFVWNLFDSASPMIPYCSASGIINTAQ